MRFAQTEIRNQSAFGFGSPPKARCMRTATEIFEAVRMPLEQFSRPPHNALTLLSNEKYAEKHHETDLLARRGHRSGQLLTSTELASLAHLPLGPRVPTVQPDPIPPVVVSRPAATKPAQKPKRPTVLRKESAAPKLLAEEAKASVSPPAAQQSAHGYTVRVQVKTLGEEEKELRQQAVSQVLANAIKRLGIESEDTE